MKDPTFAPAYCAFYPMLTEIARTHGYALTIHGSVVRDFDLVAIPWTEQAVPAQELFAAVNDYMGRMYVQEFRQVQKLLEPEVKPHGRLAWSIPVGNGAVIDLSVMPRQL